MRERSKGGYKKKYKESVTGVREMRRRKRERKDRMERERNEEEGGSIFPCVRGLNALVGLKWSGALTDRPPGAKTQPIRLSDSKRPTLACRKESELLPLVGGEKRAACLVLGLTGSQLERAMCLRKHI